MNEGELEEFMARLVEHDPDLKKVDGTRDKLKQVKLKQDKLKYDSDSNTDS